jgi:alpha/beta superfamily hydrolase
MIITGDRDRLVEAEDLQPNLDSFATPVEYRVVEGADHFWGGRESQAVRPVAEFFAQHLR